MSQIRLRDIVYLLGDLFVITDKVSNLFYIFFFLILDLTSAAKIKRVLLTIGKIIVLLGLLYMFICSLSFLSSAFRLLGGKTAGN